MSIVGAVTSPHSAPGIDWSKLEDNAQSIYKRNMGYAVQAPITSYNTSLPPDQEQQFRQWVQANKVPFDAEAPVTDYDMRGYWQALQNKKMWEQLQQQGKVPKEAGSIDPNDNKYHYPDYWKTPLHETFSSESKWADLTKAPKWNDKDQLVLPDGTVIFDDRARKAKNVDQKNNENKKMVKAVKGKDAPTS